MNKTILIAAGCGLSLLFAQSAAAKVINLGTMSRTAVQQACQRSGGSTFGMEAEDNGYGCRSDHGQIICSADSNCDGLVSDLIPMTGNSADAVLGGGQRSGPSRVVPVSPRIDSSVSK